MGALGKVLSTSAEIPGDSGSRGPQKTVFRDRFGFLAVFVRVSGKNGMPQREEMDQAGGVKSPSSVVRGRGDSCLHRLTLFLGRSNKCVLR